MSIKQNVRQRRQRSFESISHNIYTQVHTLQQTGRRLIASIWFIIKLHKQKQINANRTLYNWPQSRPPSITSYTFNVFFFFSNIFLQISLFSRVCLCPYGFRKCFCSNCEMQLWIEPVVTRWNCLSNDRLRTTRTLNGFVFFLCSCCYILWLSIPSQWLLTYKPLSISLLMCIYLLFLCFKTKKIQLFLPVLNVFFFVFDSISLVRFLFFCTEVKKKNTWDRCEAPFLLH